MVCAAPTTATGSCSYPNTCALSGTRTDVVTSFACGGGSCQGNPMNVGATCTRSTAGNPCGATVVDPGSCSYAATCDNTGARTETTSTFACNSGGSCQRADSSAQVACTRNPTGMPCGATTVDPGSCSYPSTCATTGSRTETVTTFACNASNGCDGSPSPSSQPCTRATAGTSCASFSTCNGTGACQCDGCITSTGTCVAGTSKSACGSGGVVCDNCAGPNFFCNGSQVCEFFDPGCGERVCP